MFPPGQRGLAGEEKVGDEGDAKMLVRLPERRQRGDGQQVGGDRGAARTGRGERCKSVTMSRFLNFVFSPLGSMSRDRNEFFTLRFTLTQ